MRAVLVEATIRGGLDAQHEVFYGVGGADPRVGEGALAVGTGRAAAVLRAVDVRRRQAACAGVACLLACLALARPLSALGLARLVAGAATPSSSHAVALAPLLELLLERIVVLAQLVVVFAEAVDLFLELADPVAEPGELLHEGDEVGDVAAEHQLQEIATQPTGGNSLPAAAFDTPNEGLGR